MGSKIRKIRQFSTEFKKEKVSQIDGGKITVLQLSRIYDVSATAVYKWVRKYSRYAGQNEKVVVLFSWCVNSFSNVEGPTSVPCSPVRKPCLGGLFFFLRCFENPRMCEIGHL